jgi:hypothetical protein
VTRATQAPTQQRGLLWQERVSWALPDSATAEGEGGSVDDGVDIAEGATEVGEHPKGAPVAGMAADESLARGTCKGRASPCKGGLVDR